MKMKILFYSLPPKLFCKAMIQKSNNQNTNHVQIPIESLHTADENNDSEQINDNLEPGHKKSETEKRDLKKKKNCILNVENLVLLLSHL